VTTFAALGDSITLGVGDPVGRAWRGWAVLLAEGLPEPRLHMLAANGACIADVERHQLPAALPLRPDLASVIVGVNDTLRPGFDPARIAASAGHTVGALRATGAAVLTMRLPDPGRMLGLPSALARPLARRAAEVNAVMDEVAARFGTLHFDAARAAETYEPSMWAVDRLHPSERGHRMLACRFHDQLAATGFAVGPRPDPRPSSPPPSRLAEFCWLATRGTAWVLRRSTDLVPSLLAMAFREWREGGDLPDASAADASVAATARLAADANVVADANVAAGARVAADAGAEEGYRLPSRPARSGQGAAGSVDPAGTATAPPVP
jgi:lysophospholipase L1-like esterase